MGSKLSGAGPNNSAAVVSGLRGIHPLLESVFDTLYARRAELY